MRAVAVVENAGVGMNIFTDVLSVPHCQRSDHGHEIESITST